MKRFITGIKPTGRLHLGNYFGMVGQALAIQEREVRNGPAEQLVFLADYHALTTSRDPKALRQNTQDMARTLIALGLDPADTTLFRQSAVPEVHELAWLLSCVTGMGTLTRAHAYKAAVAEGEEGLMNHGTFSYPVLMAADILLYEATDVPVGTDQHQHVQIAEEVCRHFQREYGRGTLVRPRARLYDGPEVLGCDGRKMSKSYGNALSVIAGTTELDEYVRRIRTDSTPVESPKDPETCLVAKLHRLVATDEAHRALRSQYAAGGYGYGQAKAEFKAAFNLRFGEARDRFYSLTADEVEHALEMGAKRARALATKTLEATRQVTGLT